MPLELARKHTTQHARKLRSMSLPPPPACLSPIARIAGLNVMCIVAYMNDLRVCCLLTLSVIGVSERHVDVRGCGLGEM